VIADVFPQHLDTHELVVVERMIGDIHPVELLAQALVADADFEGEVVIESFDGNLH
jgi:hypothetical protein